MSQLSQFSVGALSDIIPDVDNFIEETGIEDDLGHILGDEQYTPPVEDDEEEELNIKPFATANQPLPPITQYPPDQPINLGTDEYYGPFNFEVLVIPSEQKTPWEYSSKLNKIFIGINLKFPVAFSLNYRPNFHLFVRATPVYSQSQFFQEPVHRCVGHQHAQDTSNKGLEPHIYQHIIRCGNDQTQYFGTKNAGRLSTVIPLGVPQTGSDVVKEFYHFVCKNSCPLGMNRRPIDVVFTLEDENGEVFGRRLLSVRVCSCPKRDREKEEKDVEKSNSPRSFKRRKLAGGRDGSGGSNDLKVYSINANIVGKSNYLHVLTVARDRMAAEIVAMGGEVANNHPFRKNCNELTQLIDKVKSE